ncbi:MAG TPA: GGDEF domain-containing protein [Candidatus Sulfotelmatobacter sp.]|nr:GGDEF domain-containing protein [Candidatus Sulfotelmatobacter sp.]
MRFWNRAALRTLFVPDGVVFLAMLALAYSSWFTLALPALNFLYYCAIVGGMLLAWRFHSSRTFLSLSVIFLAQQVNSLSEGQAYVSTLFQAIPVLVAIDFILIALMHERGFTLQSISPVALLLFVESFTVAVFLGSGHDRPSPLIHHHVPEAISFPPNAIFILSATGLFFVARFLLTRKPADAAFFWSLCSIAMAFRFAELHRVSILFWATGACILSISIVENSYLLAYHDELTALPSRRAFNDASLRLKHPYSVAAVDIDHFKRFNDTYGHDTGDQVLRLVAANLARVTGGGEAYRCGGEEFTILFPGKTTPDIVDHLEELRETIASAEFRLRGNDRRQAPRGPERRNERGRGRSRKADAIRQLAATQSSEGLSVTVSIGIATSSDQSEFEKVLKAADKALYRAKENGRNRVETASTSRRTSKSKAAGIA